MFGMFFLGVLYLQRILGYDAIEIGLAFLPVSTLIGALSLGVSARLNLRFGPRATLVPGLALVAVALAYFSRAPVDGDYVSRRAAGRWCCSARAPGLVFPAVTTISMSGVLPGRRGPRVRRGQHEHAGRRGVRPRGARRAGDRQDRDAALARRHGRAALTGGYQLAFLVAAGLVGAAIVLATVVLRSEPPVAEREREQRAHAGEPSFEAA